MKGFTYENQGAETMLVYRLGEGEHLDSFAKGMLQSNEMAGILRPSFTQRDAEQYLKFPVTSRISLQQFIEREMEKGTVLNLFLTMAGAIQEVEEYMLSPEKILLDPEYIFVNIRQKEAGLLYLPVDEFHQDVTVKDFFLYLLSHMQYELDQDISYVAKLIHFLNQQKPWTFEELKRYIGDLANEPKNLTTVKERPVSPAPERAESSRPEQVPVQSQKISDIPQAPRMPQTPKVPEIPAVPVSQEAGSQQKKGLFSKQEEKKKGSRFAFGKKKEKTPGNIPGMAIPGQGGSPSGMAIPGQSGSPSGIAIPGQGGSPSGMAIPGQSGSPSGMAIPGQAIPPVMETSQPEKKSGSGKWSFGRNKKEARRDEEPVSVPGFSESRKEQAISYQPASPFPAYEQEEKKTSSYMDYGSSDDESRTVIMGGGMDYGSTMILGSDQSGEERAFTHVVKIIRRRTGQTVVINKDLFRIGSEASFVDLFIGDNSAIGSCHANICERDGAYYIMDQNSVNHTYVNGRMAQPGELVQLSGGNVITLADEDFDFIIS